MAGTVDTAILAEHEKPLPKYRSGDTVAPLIALIRQRARKQQKKITRDFDFQQVIH